MCDYSPASHAGRSNNDSQRIKSLKKGACVYWRGDAADSGIVTETTWDAVTIAWNNGRVARIHHGDIREIQRTPTTPHTV